MRAEEALALVTVTVVVVDTFAVTKLLVAVWVGDAADAALRSAVNSWRKPGRLDERLGRGRAEVAVGAEAAQDLGVGHVGAADDVVDGAVGGEAGLGRRSGGRRGRRGPRENGAMASGSFWIGAGSCSWTSWTPATRRRPRRCWPP